jgi:hypothetical protein
MSSFVDQDVPLTPAPPFAQILFDGADSRGWIGREGQAFDWKVQDGYMEVVPGKGDICSRSTFRNFQLHLEFWLPHMPSAKGQDRANSGVYLQGLYEIQILDSYQVDPADNTCGALYKTAAALFNACKKPERWQSYDIVFYAPQFGSDGRCKKPGRLSVLQNGVAIHNHLEFDRATGAGLQIKPGEDGPILLQDHGDLVRFRNIWIVSY